jgi:Glycogen recognition site of AMP-activated protein kinase
MKDQIHRHLDGELSAEVLEPDERGVVDEWDRMVAAFRTAAPEMTGTPPWLEQKVMSRIDALPPEGPLARAVQWILRPAPVPVSPLAAGLVAALFAAVIALPGRDVPGGSGSPTAGPAGGASGPVAQAGVETGVTTIVYVQFVLEAPGARSVAVAGDFSEWEPTFALEDADGNGVWTGRIPVEAGVHSYMFLIDDVEWQTDPNADSYQDDGFGNQNAVLAVASGD